MSHFWRGSLGCARLRWRGYGTLDGRVVVSAVIEIGSSAATSYCARLFAAVQKLQSPLDDQVRRSAPLTQSTQSAWFAIAQDFRIDPCFFFESLTLRVAT